MSGTTVLYKVSDLKCTILTKDALKRLQIFPPNYRVLALLHV